MSTNEERTKALQAIYNRDGLLKPEVVISEARNPKNPLHSYFEWNDTIAGEQHRLAQARTLIKSVKIEIIHENRVVRSVVYAKDPRVPHDQQGYTAVSAIAQTREDSRAALLAEISRIEGCIVRAELIAKRLPLLKLDRDLARLSDLVTNIRAKLVAEGDQKAA